MGRSTIHRSDFLWLGLILALAAVLRIAGLNAPLWYDEILTVDQHLRLPWGQMLDGYSMNNHYLFNLQSKLSIRAFGESPWAIRLPALAFGLASIAALWWLARDVAGSAIAHITALLLALSYHHIWFSQNARGYSELAFFSTVGMLLFLRGMARPSLGIWLAYGGVLALAVFTHLTGAFLFAAQGMVWLAVLFMDRTRGNFRAGGFRLPLIGYVAGGLLTLLLYAPLIPSLLDTVGGVSGTSAIDVMQEYQSPLWSLLEGIRTALGAGGGLVGAVAVVVILLSALGSHAAHRTSPLYAPTVWLHILLTLALLLALGMRIWPRFFFADIGFLLLLIVLGVRSVVDGFNRLTGTPIPNLFAIAVVAMVVLSAGLAARNYSAPKQNMAGAFDFVENIRSPGERVYSVGQGSAVFRGYFQADWGEIQTDTAYRAARDTPGPMLLAVAFPARSLRVIPTLDRDTEDTLELVKRFPGTLGDGAILIFRRPK